MTCPLGHILYHAMPIRPNHIPCRTIYHMQCLPGLTIYHAMPPQQILCHAGQAISNTMPCIARPCYIPCYASTDQILYHVMPARSYHMPCLAHQARPYTMPCLPGYTIIMSCIIRSYHILRHFRHAIPFPMACPLGHIKHHVHQAISHTMPCPPGHTICHAMLARTSHIPCHVSPGHTIYLTMSARSYHIPCYAMANNYFGHKRTV